MNAFVDHGDLADLSGSSTSKRNGAAMSAAFTIMYCMSGFRFPYDNSLELSNVRLWFKQEWKREHAISSRAVNSIAAPGKIIWQEEDDIKLN